MLWCITVPHFSTRNRRLRRPLNISAPIPCEEMQLRNSHTAANASHVNRNPRPESAIFYLVPNKLGPGKTIVRRPVPPLASPTSDENFNAIKHGKTTSRDGGTPSGSTIRGRPTLAIRTVSPLAEQSNGVIAYPTVDKSRFDALDSFRNSFRGMHLGNDGSSTPKGLIWKGKGRADEVQNDGNDGSSTPRGLVWKGKGRADEVHNDEAERKNADASDKAKEKVLEWRRMKTGSNLQRTETHPLSKQENHKLRNATRTRRTVGDVRNLFKDHPAKALKSGDKGPKAGQTYEIVGRRIIEDNPDRTVTISTWREQVEKEVVSDTAERMSVYYVGADDYAQEGAYVEEARLMTETIVPPSEKRRKSAIVDPFLGRKISKRPAGSGEASSSKSPPVLQRPGHLEQYHQLGKPSTCSSHDESLSSSMCEMEQETPSRSPLLDPATEGGIYIVNSIPHSSTPPEQSPDTFSRRPRRYKESTPIEKALPQSPFHPTRSGSTISSIKSESTVELERILDSCEPTLIHIAPILQSLGIRKVEHLKAVARLTPVTRDREVKEGALRLGITVMEWAILVDRIFSL
ncbi:hypothetical protein B0H34DRAFT_706631 [Crassisporium funariophilum]|nr:hypothetical protein B0H34DRAFT_706631 [Crassisporium funariophilum]